MEPLSFRKCAIRSVRGMHANQRNLLGRGGKNASACKMITAARVDDDEKS